MLKKTMIFALFFLLALDIGYTAKREKPDHSGRRKLTLKQRITAEGRYNKLKLRFRAPRSDRDDFNSQLLYIENGYYDYGFFDAEKYSKRYKRRLPEGWWVYVYPYWYVWGNQDVSFRDYDYR